MIMLKISSSGENAAIRRTELIFCVLLNKLEVNFHFWTCFAERFILVCSIIQHFFHDFNRDLELMPGSFEPFPDTTDEEKVGENISKISEAFH